MLFNKKGIKLTQDAIPTIFDANPLTQPIQPTAKEVALPPIEEALIPERSFRHEPDFEFIAAAQPSIACDRCIQQDVTIRALMAEITQLKATCTEQQAIINSLRKGNDIQIAKQPNPIEAAISPKANSHLPVQQNEKHMIGGSSQQTAKSDFDCFICKMKLESLEAMQRHMTEIHGCNDPCSVCNQKFKSSELGVHKCAGLELMECAYCQQTCASTKSLLQHLNECNKSEKHIYKCSLCRKQFFMESLVSVHIEHHGNTEKKFVCKICTKNFATAELLCAHEKRHNAVGSE